MKIAVLISASVLVAGCGVTIQSSTRATHRAGLKTKIWYQSQDDILAKLEPGGANQEEIEIERHLIPKGGQIVLRKTDHSAKVFRMGPDLRLDHAFTTVEKIRLYKNGEVVHSCESLEKEYPKRGIFSKLFSGSTYFEKCAIPIRIDGNFEAILLNFEDKPIGKYAFDRPIQ